MTFPTRRSVNRETIRSLLIASTVIAAALSLWFGLPRVLDWTTPELQRVWVVSSSLGDQVASAAPKEVLAGTPVTLYAVVETGTGSRRRFYGPVDRVRLGGEGAEIVEVRPWSTWWHELEVLWFKVEPVYAFDNETMVDDFDPATILYTDTFMLAWGFRDQHPADITPTGDAFPRVDVGTMRFKVEAVIRDVRDRMLGGAVSPGAEGVHATTLAEQPYRVSVRASDAALGVILGFSGLPYVPVAAGIPAADHPATCFLGGTILDFWIATQRRLGDAELPFFGWEDLPARAELVVEEMFLADDGNYYHTADPLRPVTFEEVRPGDLVTIEDHVGVLYEDRSPGGAGDGILNTWDRLLGGYFEPIRDMPMGDAFVSGITIYRLPAPAASGDSAPNR